MAKPIIFLICLSFACSPALTQDLIHPGGFNSLAELNFIAQKVNARQEPWTAAFEQLQKGRWGGMDYAHKAYVEVICGRHNDPNIGCEQMVDDGMAAYAQSMQWVVTKNPAHADKAIQILNAWSYKYEKNSDFNDKLLASWAAVFYANAAEIIRHTDAGWADKDVDQFKLMAKKLLHHASDGQMYNNALMTQIEAQTAIAIFLDDRAQFEKAIDNWRMYIPTYFYLNSDGTPKTIRRPISIWNSKTFVEGQCMETCRDYGHSKLGFNSVIGAAQMAWTQKVDLFAEEKERLTAFMNTHAKWTMGIEAVPATVCDGQVSCTGSGSPVGTGTRKMPCGKDSWDTAYRHFADRLKMQLPLIKEMKTTTGPRNMGRWTSKPETLISDGIPFTLGPDGAVSVLPSPRLSAFHQREKVYPIHPGFYRLDRLVDWKLRDFQGREFISDRSLDVDFRGRGPGHYILENSDGNSLKIQLE